MNQIIFISDTAKGRVYKFSTKDEERKFRLFWMMGFITDPYSQSNKPNK
jgi:hypothetical protein